METDRSESLEFYSTSSLEDIKIAIQAKPRAESLSFTECLCLTSADSFREIVRLLNRNLSSLHVTQLTEFNQSSVALLTERCSNLKEIKFTSCPGLDNDSFRFVGEHCYKLKSFVCDSRGGSWSISDDALAEFVNHSNAPALEAVTFSGFSDISDSGVERLIYKHGSTLTSIDLSQCKHITDKGVETISQNCKLLRFIRISATNVTDNGLKSLAESRPELCLLDAGNTNVTDEGVECIAGACRNLEHIILENCERVTDVSLLNLTKTCTNLKRVSFQNTGITQIPYSILRLTSLQNLDVRMCKKLVFPKPEITSGNNTNNIIMFFKEHYIGYRTRVFFLGDSSCGKSSLIRCLKDGDAKNVSMPSDGVTTELWFPFQTEDGDDSEFNKKFSEEERMLCLELWDCPSSMISNRCQEMEMTNTSIYVLICNMEEEGSLDGIEQRLDCVQNKAPTVPIIIVGTKTDIILNSDKRKDWLSSVDDILTKRKTRQQEKLKEELQHLEELDNTGKSVKHTNCRQKVSDLLQFRSRIKTTVVCTSVITGKGIDELRREIIQTVLNDECYPNLKTNVNESTSKLYNELNSLKKQGILLLTSEKFEELTRTCDIHESSEVFNVLGFLRERGVVSYAVESLPSANSPPNLPSIICINPAAIQDTLVSIHLEDRKIAFKFETKRFWPNGTNDKRPDPLVLVKAIEEIPTEGVIRECLLPLILQKFNIPEEQMLLLIKYFNKLGILVRKQVVDKKEDWNCLQLPHYSALSTDQHYYITWMDQLPNIEPRLNWTAAPFDGDLEIVVRYDFPLGVPDGFGERLIAVCCYTCYRGSYKHHWRCGFLAKIGQVLIHLFLHEQSGVHTIVFTGRVTVDEEGEHTATGRLWAELATVLHQTEIYLSQWPGLVRQVFIQPDSWYFDGEAPSNPVHIPLADCFHFLDEGEETLEISIEEHLYYIDLHELLPLTDDNELNIQQWFAWLTSQEVETEYDPYNSLETFQVLGAGELKTETKMEQPKNRGRIKWDLNDEESNCEPKEYNTVELQKAVAKFVANIIAQSFSKLAQELEQNRQLEGKLQRDKPVDEKPIGLSNSRKSSGRRRSKSPIKSKTCQIL